MALDALEQFSTSCEHAFGLFAAIVAEFHDLDDDETLTYLKRAVSNRQTLIRAPAGFASSTG